MLLPGSPAPPRGYRACPARTLFGPGFLPCPLAKPVMAGAPFGTPTGKGNVGVNRPVGRVLSPRFDAQGRFVAVTAERVQDLADRVVDLLGAGVFFVQASRSLTSGVFKSCRACGPRKRTTAARSDSDWRWHIRNGSRRLSCRTLSRTKTDSARSGRHAERSGPTARATRPPCARTSSARPLPGCGTSGAAEPGGIRS